MTSAVRYSATRRFRTWPTA